MITTGEGGMAMTNSFDLDHKIKLIRNHGITKKKEEFQTNNKDTWFYEQQILGYNFRMNDMEAALGISQLKRIKNLLDNRNLIANNYSANLINLPIKLPHILPINYCSYHLYIIRVGKYSEDNAKKNLFYYLKQKNIHCNVHYIPIHYQPFFQKFGFKKGDFPCAEEYYNEAISLPIYSKLSINEQEFIIDAIKDFFK